MEGKGFQVKKWKGCQEFQKNALFAPVVLLSIKIKKKE